MARQLFAYNAIAGQVAPASAVPLSANATRWYWRVALALPCALAGVIVWTLLALQSARQEEAAAQHLFLIQRVQPTGGVAAAATPVVFATQLGSVQSSQRIVEVLQQAAQYSNAQLDAVRIQEHAALSNRLARTDASIELKAPYAAAKAAIGESLSRLPAATVTRMQLRADPGGTLVQLTAHVSVWGAPLPSTTASAPR